MTTMQPMQGHEMGLIRRDLTWSLPLLPLQGSYFPKTGQCRQTCTDVCPTGNCIHWCMPLFSDPKLNRIFNNLQHFLKGHFLEKDNKMM